MGSRTFWRLLGGVALALAALTAVAPVAAVPTNIDSPNADPALARLFPDQIGEQPLDSWTLTGSAYLELFDPNIEADRAALDAIMAALTQRGLGPEALAVGSGVYLPPQGGFANLTAVRLAGATDIRELAPLVWDRALLSEQRQDIVLETGETVSVDLVAASPRQEPFGAVAYFEGDVAWLIEAPEEEFTAVLTAIRDAASEAALAEPIPRDPIAPGEP